MRLDDLTVELRPRSPWEAVELGMALLRRHARAVWLPWLLVTLPPFLALNLLFGLFDLAPLAGFAMWWLKPVFDRVPLFVLSRAVFGEVPSTRETLAAQRRWGLGWMAHYLTWRRLGPARSLYLPIDLLEGGARQAERRRAVGGRARGTAAALTMVCANFEAVLAAAVVAAGLMFVPTEFLSESARAMWSLLTQEPPRWAQVLLNAVTWAATSLIEPFYVAAGFGLYLNRRTQIEAWDVEIALRRMRRRLQAAVVAPLLVAALALPLLAPAPARAQASATPTVREPRTVAVAPADVSARSITSFERAVERTYTDPLLHSRKREGQWQLRDRKRQDTPPDDGSSALGAAFAFIAEFGLWILLGLLLLALIWTAPRWWPSLRDTARTSRPLPEVDVETAPGAEALPADVPAAARALWREGRVRRALALIYRASVHSLTRQTGVALAPGATEAECLRAARALDEPRREVFARAVQVWQHAAYAERVPSEAEFETLLDTLTQRFGWAT